MIHSTEIERLEERALRAVYKDHYATYSELLTRAQLPTIERLSTAFFFSRERQRGSRDLTFPAFAVCRPPFLLEEDIFPVWRERENVSICSPFLLSYRLLYSYASFIILLSHELLVKLKEFQIQAENT